MCHMQVKKEFCFNDENDIDIGIFKCPKIIFNYL